MVDQSRQLAAQARLGLIAAYREAGQEAWLSASGKSMLPLIRPGTRLLVNFDHHELQPGMIVLFARHNRLVAHRIVAVLPSAARCQLLTKGDAEPFCDQPISADEVLGVVRAIQPVGSPASSYGTSGRSARLIALLSRWNARAAVAAGRLAQLLPGPMRPRARQSIPPLARFVTQVVLFPARLVARYSQSPLRGGDLHGAVREA